MLINGQDESGQGLLVPAEGAQPCPLAGVHDDPAIQAGQGGHGERALQQRGLQRHHVGAQGRDHECAGRGPGTARNLGQNDVVGQCVEGRRADGHIRPELAGEGLGELADAEPGHDSPACGRGDGDAAIGIGHERHRQQVGAGGVPLEAGDDPVGDKAVGNRIWLGARSNEHAFSTVPALCGVLRHDGLLAGWDQPLRGRSGDRDYGSSAHCVSNRHEGQPRSGRAD